MTDFRALCAELADSIELLLEMRPVEAKPLQITEDRLARARNALAEPEPEGPTDDDLWDIGERHLWTGTDESTIAYDRILTSFITAARAVLARWGNYPASPDSSTPPRSEND